MIQFQFPAHLPADLALILIALEYQEPRSDRNGRPNLRIFLSAVCTERRESGPLVLPALHNLVGSQQRLIPCSEPRCNRKFVGEYMEFEFAGCMALIPAGGVVSGFRTPSEGRCARRD